MELKFGFMREEDRINWKGGVIEPLPEIKSTIAAIDASGRVCGGWFHPPLIDAEGKPPLGMPNPMVHAKVFELAPTHKIVIDSVPQESDYVNFIIGLLGLMKGLKLVAEGWNHFYRVPTQRCKLNDFRSDNSSTAKTLELGTEFWLENNNPEVRQLIVAANHWHLFGQLYEHGFERFNAQYIVLDTCFKLYRKLYDIKKNDRHSHRPTILCENYSLSVPVWANLDSTGNTCPLSDCRNNFFHEGIYGEVPIGFGYPTVMPSIDSELTAFNTRLILAILGVRNNYTKSPVDTGQYYDFYL